MIFYDPLEVIFNTISSYSLDKCRDFWDVLFPSILYNEELETSVLSGNKRTPMELGIDEHTFIKYKE